MASNEITIEALIEAAPVQMDVANIDAIREWARGFIGVSTEFLVSDCCKRNATQLDGIKGSLRSLADELKQVFVAMGIDRETVAQIAAKEQQVTLKYVHANRETIYVELEVLGACLNQLLRTRRYAAGLLSGDQAELPQEELNPEQPTGAPKSTIKTSARPRITTSEDSSASVASLAFDAIAGSDAARRQLAKRSAGDQPPFAIKGPPKSWLERLQFWRRRKKP